MALRILAVGVGLTHYYNQLLNRLQSDLGAEVDLIVASGGRGHVGEGVFQTARGIEFRTHPAREWVALGSYRSFAGLAGSIRRFRPDIVLAGAEHLPAFALEPLVRAALATTGAGLLVKSIPFRLPRYQEALATVPRGVRGLLRRALVELRASTFRFAGAHILHVAEGVEIYRSWGVAPGRIFVAGNSPDTDRLFLARERIAQAAPVLPDNPHRLIHIGRLVEWKRVDLLIEALADLRRTLPGAELVVVGEGPEAPRLKELARTLGVAGSVRFAGGVYEPEELGRYLLASAVYVLAGMGGLSINDAMCFGKPVVCSVCDGTEKLLVREGFNGSYFQAGDRSSLAAAINGILQDPERCRQMGERSLAIVRDEVNIHTVIATYRRAIEFLRSR